MALLAVIPLAYLAGSIPTAYLLTRWLRGVDIRTLGSGNPGAVNVFRHVGPPAGLFVLTLDALKGAAAVLIVKALDLGDAAVLAAAMASVAGHNWPVFLGFHGGKGVATIFGISMAILPVWTLVAVAAAAAGGLAARSVVFGIASGIIALNIAAIATGQGTTQVTLCLTLSAVVVATHYAISYKAVVSAVKRHGAWGLFEPE